MTFGLGAYDRTRPLVIDPILSYAVVVGGQGLDEAVAVAVDGSGNVYVAGTTSSPDFPGATGPGGGLDVFVTKLDPRGTRVLFSAYIGGSGIDEARGLAIDSEGHAYVVGSTTSTNFPTRNPRQPANAGGTDGFVFKLSTLGTGLVFSTYHGGTGPTRRPRSRWTPRNVYVAGSDELAGPPGRERRSRPIRATSTGGSPSSRRRRRSAYGTYLGGDAERDPARDRRGRPGQRDRDRRHHLVGPADAGRGAAHLRRRRRRAHRALHDHRRAASSRRSTAASAPTSATPSPRPPTAGRSSRQHDVALPDGRRRFRRRRAGRSTPS